MNAVIRLDFATRQLEMGRTVIGIFTPTSTTEGVVALGTSSYTYVIRPRTYGEVIELYQMRRRVAVREYDFHDGVFSLRVGEDLAFDLDKEILYGPNGTAGTVAFTKRDLTMEFNSLVPAGSVALVAAVVALDTMWANLVGFTRARPEPRR